MFGSLFHQHIETGNGIGTYTKFLSHYGQRNISSYQAAEYQYSHLYHICIGYHLHPAKGNDECKNSKANHNYMEVIAPG
ncbi:hypothetical protein D3C87_2044100 [compost metagenome]